MSSSSDISRKKTPSYITCDNGLIVSEFTDLNHLSSALAFIPDDDDVFICTYPKCGTTWMQYILYMMHNGGQPLQPGQNINLLVPHIESDGPGALGALSRPRIIKTHLPYSMLPKNPKSKYICIARNPKDCCVSFYHHTRGFVKYYDFGDGTFDDYFEVFLAGKVDFNDYFDHLLSYVEHKDDPNVLFLLYEEMKKDVRWCMRRIGCFLGGPFLQSSEDEEVLERIAMKTSLKEMQATPLAWSTERERRFEPFVRKGVVGDWRTHFSEEQSRRMDDKFRERLSGTPAEHFWDDYDC